MIDPELQKQIDLLAKDIDEIKNSVSSIKRAMRWGAVLGWVKIALFIVPIIIAYFYLLPLLEPMLKTYSQLLNPTGNLNSGTLDLDSLKNLLEQTK